MRFRWFEAAAAAINMRSTIQYVELAPPFLSRPGIRLPSHTNRFASTALPLRRAKVKDATIEKWETDGGSLGIPKKF